MSGANHLTPEDVRYLRWGETPFTGLSPDELMRHCQRLYAACESMASCLAVSRAGSSEHNPYWGPGGAGGRALEQGEQALKAANAGIDKESIYRSFFRYARDLLFEPNGSTQIGFGWHVCSACGTMVGARGDKPGELIGRRCEWTTDCKGELRLITWDDLKPRETGDER